MVKKLEKIVGCKEEFEYVKPRNPELAVDGIVRYNGGIVLIERLNEPFGWAFPGGFIDYGESAESALEREMFEEINLRLSSYCQFGFYSEPDRDPRRHVASVVYVANGFGELRAKDDAKSVSVVPEDEVLNYDLVFDHKKIWNDYLKLRNE